VTTALWLLAVALLTLGTGYCVMAEFAYVAARRNRLEDLAARGDKKAARALSVLGRLSFMLSGAQLGITVTTLVTGFIAEPALARVLRPVLELSGVPEQASFAVSLALGFTIATFLQMIFGELAPKNLAIARPEQIARALAWSVLLVLRIAGPVIRFFDGAANRLLHRLGIEPVEELHGGAGPEELEFIVAESEITGHLSGAQSARLRRALDYRELTASDVMVPRPAVTVVPAAARIGELRSALATGHSRLPAFGGNVDEVVGVLHVVDLFGLPYQRRAGARVSKIMRPVTEVPESLPLDDTLETLRAAGTRLAAVVDEYGGFAGLLTAEDLLEELVGEIRDDNDPAHGELHIGPEGSVVVPGMWRLHEFEREVGVELPEGPYETVAGLVVYRLERLAEVGDEVALVSPDLRFHVDAVERRAIIRVRVSGAALSARGTGHGNGSGA
jgi:CBS domain containing-hemolysin-like protein